MYNILIIGENLFETCCLVKKIMEEQKNVNLFNNIFSNYIDAIQLIKSNIPDIILIILKNYDEINNIDIIKYININHLTKYKESIVVYIEDGIIPANAIRNSYILSYINNINQINDIIFNKNKEKIMKKQDVLKRIQLEMKKLNFKFSYIGTKYMLECIFEIYLNKDYENINLNRDIYPIIAKRYNTSINNIKSNITQSYIRMIYDCSIDTLEDYLKIYVGKQNPKKKEVINAILRNVI
jgi:hypothetical protein